MIFWTLLLFVISLFGLLRGPVFFETTKRIQLLSIDKAQGKIDEDKLGKEFLKDGCMQWLIAMFLAIAEVIYLVNAIQYDSYKLPTIGAILFFIFSFIVAFSKKSITKMNEKELIIKRAKVESSKKFTFWTFPQSLVWSIYYGYMFYILVF